jgi:hypothetical protein
MRAQTADRLPQGEVMLFDGIGMIARGDLLTVLYRGDARAHRSAWIFERMEQMVASGVPSVVGLLVIPPESKPPDQAARATESAAYERFGRSIRRVVTVPEGSPFRVSVVRLVMAAHVTILRRGDFVLISKGVDDGVRLVVETKTALTPSAEQILSDIERLRGALPG